MTWINYGSVIGMDNLGRVEFVFTWTRPVCQVHPSRSHTSDATNHPISDHHNLLFTALNLLDGPLCHRRTISDLKSTILHRQFPFSIVVRRQPTFSPIPASDRSNLTLSNQPPIKATLLFQSWRLTFPTVNPSRVASPTANDCPPSSSVENLELDILSSYPNSYLL